MAKIPARITDRHLKRWVKKWQKILRLEDWDIRIELVRQYDLEPEDQARVKRLSTQRKAKIEIVDPGDYGPDQLSGPQDIEQTIVHELVHVYFVGLDKFEGAAMTLYEQAVDSLATALVNCDRKRK